MMKFFLLSMVLALVESKGWPEQQSINHRQEEEHTCMKRLVIRFLWLLLLVAQIVLYFMSYSHLAGAEAKYPSWPGGRAMNTLLLDSLSVFFWCGLLFFFEIESSFSKWVRYPLMALCVLITLDIVRMNLLALIGA